MVRCYKHSAAGPWQVGILIAGSSKRRSLFIAGDRRRSVYDKKPQRYAEDNRTAFNERFIRQSETADNTAQ